MKFTFLQAKNEIGFRGIIYKIYNVYNFFLSMEFTVGKYLFLLLTANSGFTLFCNPLNLYSSAADLIAD